MRMIIACVLTTMLCACGTMQSRVPIYIDQSLLERPEKLTPLNPSKSQQQKSSTTQQQTTKPEMPTASSIMR